MFPFDPPSFYPHPFWRGGHLQTIAPSRDHLEGSLDPIQIRVAVSDGDQIVLHIDQPVDWVVTHPTVLLIHGLTGCHGAPYMIRMAKYFLSIGYRVARMDMRGYGSAWSLSKNLTHAGRSDDVIAGLQHLATLDQVDSTQPGGVLFAIGISLGGGQLLRGISRIEAGIDSPPSWLGRLAAIAAVSPPIDLARCSRQMDRRGLAFYNYYFIRSLLRRTPQQVRQREDYRNALKAGTPRTLGELDQRITAPLSGFDSAKDYYEQSSARRTVSHLKTPTLVLAAQDDPIVPFDCFAEMTNHWSDSTCLVAPSSGGHVGFIDRRGRGWIDRTISKFFTAAGMP